MHEPATLDYFPGQHCSCFFFTKKLLRVFPSRAAPETVPLLLLLQSDSSSKDEELLRPLPTASCRCCAWAAAVRRRLLLRLVPPLLLPRAAGASSSFPRLLLSARGWFALVRRPVALVGRLAALLPRSSLSNSLGYLPLCPPNSSPPSSVPRLPFPVAPPADNSRTRFRKKLYGRLSCNPLLPAAASPEKQNPPAITRLSRRRSKTPLGSCNLPTQKKKPACVVSAFSYCYQPTEILTWPP